MDNHKVYRIIQVTFVAFFILFLASCSTTKVVKKDGPPKFYVDETKIPNAVPRPVRLSKYGNMPFYTVFGKRYYVMPSSKNYKEIGIASWYGTKFQKRPTSNGERYDMLTMTAAHRTLPLPTFVEVINLANHRKIIVKVNDRGPFADNRIIDLSYVAAKKLDMLGRGTALVSVRAINPDIKPTVIFAKRNTKTQIPSKALWQANPTHLAQQKKVDLLRTRLMYLQVGAFRSKANAERLRSRLVALLGTPVYITNPQNHLRLYRVKIGPIKDLLTADKITNQLKDLGIKSNKTYGV